MDVLRHAERHTPSQLATRRARGSRAGKLVAGYDWSAPLDKPFNAAASLVAPRPNDSRARASEAGGRGSTGPSDRSPTHGQEMRSTPPIQKTVAITTSGKGNSTIRAFEY